MCKGREGRVQEFSVMLVLVLICVSVCVCAFACVYTGVEVYT